MNTEDQIIAPPIIRVDTVQHNARQSNIELLRVVSMLLVMMLHTCYNGIQSWYDTPTYEIENFVRFLVEAVSIVGVNCFILISGYFGIRLKLKSVANIAFQVYFFSILGLIVCDILNSPVPTSTLLRCIFPLSNYIWFLPCYLLLMLFSPILNSWLKSSSTQQIALLTILLYGITYYWGIVWKDSHGFGGYSFGFFIILYIVGHLIARYRECHTPNKWMCLSGYLACVTLLLLISAIQFKYPLFTSLIWNYDCPIVFAESIFLFMFFTCVDIGSNRFVNWVGRSCFAVLLLHITPCSTYLQWLQQVSEQTSGIVTIMWYALIVITYYLAAILLDQCRLFLWNKLILPYFRK